MSQLTDKVESAILESVKKLGLELEYSELVKEGGNSIYRIVIDKKDSNVSVEDCESLSRAVEDIVDKYVNVQDGYVLEVSSAGLERQLKNVRLYKKYLGHDVKVKLYKKIGELKEIEGTLISANESEIVLNKDGKEICIEYSNIAHANTIYNFENI